MTEGAPAGWAPHPQVGAAFLAGVAGAVTGLAVLVLLLAAAVVPLALEAHRDVLSSVGQVVPFLPIAAAAW